MFTMYPKKIYIDLLGYIKENQSPEMIYNTALLVLPDRFPKYKKKKIDKAIKMLIHSGCIKKTSGVNLIITPEGKEYLENYYKFRMANFFGKFIAVTSFIAIIISIVSLLLSIEKYHLSFASLKCLSAQSFNATDLKLKS